MCCTAVLICSLNPACYNAFYFFFPDVTNECKADPDFVMTIGSSFALNVFDFRYWIKKSSNYEVQLRVYKKLSHTSNSVQLRCQYVCLSQLLLVTCLVHRGSDAIY